MTEKGMKNMFQKSEYREWLRQLKEENPELAHGSEEEIIYSIDDVDIYGGFDEGYRSIDHVILLNSNITWKHILAYGTLIVPETQTYISDLPIERFETIGLTRLPLNSNHIVGFRELEHLEQGVDLDPYSLHVSL